MTAALAVALGILLGLGLWMLLAAVPRFGAPRLAVRVAPYVSGISPAARDLAERRPSDPASFLGALVAPAAGAARRALGAVLGDASTARRLRQAGWTYTVEGFRGRQLAAGAVGAAVGMAASVLAVRQGAGAVVPVVAVATGAVAGVLIPDRMLARAAEARRRRIGDELPTVLEFLAIALAAGEGVSDAVRRIARSGGDLAAGFAVAAAETGAGVPFADALRRLAADADVPALTRAVEQLLGALERGSPLVDVLRAQAEDSRDEAKRRLLESAGRREIAMLVPLVFMILPVTVAFALFPGLMVLRLGF